MSTWRGHLRYVVFAAPYASKPVGTTNACLPPSVLFPASLLGFLQVARLADALYDLANDVGQQLGTQGQLCIHDVISDTTRHICSSLIQRAGSVQGVTDGYPHLLLLAQYLVKSLLITRGLCRHAIWLVHAFTVSSPPSKRCYLNYTMLSRTKILISVRVPLHCGCTFFWSLFRF